MRWRVVCFGDYDPTQPQCAGCGYKDTCIQIALALDITDEEADELAEREEIRRYYEERYRR